MKRPYLALVCALALLLAGAGCSDQPKVSSTPDTTVRPSETPVHSETPSAAMPDCDSDAVPYRKLKIFLSGSLIKGLFC